MIKLLELPAPRDGCLPRCGREYPMMDPSWQWPQYPRREAPPPATRPPSGREGRSGFLSSLETSSSISPRAGSCDPPCGSIAERTARHHQAGPRDHRGDNRCRRTGPDRRCLHARHRSHSHGKPSRARSSLDAADKDRHGRQIRAIEVQSAALRGLSARVSSTIRNARWRWIRSK